MNKTTKLFFTLVAITLLWQSVALSVNKNTYIEPETVDVTENFHQGVAEITVKDQERELTIKNETIKQLEQAVLDLNDTRNFDNLAYEDTAKLLVYCLLYIQILQVKLDQNGLDYPTFIVDEFLNDLLKGIKEEK